MTYGVLAWRAVCTEIPCAPPDDAHSRPAVTLLKPLCGVEAGTYDCLRSFCNQAYPKYQVIFGVADSHDPVVAIAKRLRAEFPDKDVKIVVDSTQHGSSRKVSNLINMMPHAVHDYLVLADCDVQVEPDYLAEVVAPLLQSDVGIVTCAYRGVSKGGLWSTLESLFINDWFIPSVRVAALAGSRAFAFGSSISIRRDVLFRVGGFMAIANQLADDYRLGELTRHIGLRTVLSGVVVDIAVAERSFAQLVRHELRWLRTIRALRPLAYSFCFVTFTVPIALVATWLSQDAPAVLGMLAITVAARIGLHLRTRQTAAPATQWLMVVLRDALSVMLWCWSFVTRRVQWRDDEFRVQRDGSVQLVARITQ